MLQCFIKSFTGAPTCCNVRKCYPLAPRNWDVSIFCKVKQIKVPAKFQHYGSQPFLYLLHFDNPKNLR